MQKFFLSFFPEKDIQIVCFPVDHSADRHELALDAIEDHISLADQIAHIRVDFKTGAERRAGLRKLLEICALGKILSVMRLAAFGFPYSSRMKRRIAVRSFMARGVNLSFMRPTPTGA